MSYLKFLLPANVVVKRLNILTSTGLKFKFIKQDKLSPDYWGYRELALSLFQFSSAVVPKHGNSHKCHFEGANSDRRVSDYGIKQQLRFLGCASE